MLLVGHSYYANHAFANIDLAGAWSSLLLFESVVFLLTLIKALQLGRAWRGGLFYVLLRDGQCFHSRTHQSVINVPISLGTIYYGSV